MLKNRQSGCLAACFILAGFAYTACDKTETTPASATALQVFLTDHPAAFEQVRVTVSSVEAKIDSSENCRDDQYGTRGDHQDHDGDDHRARRDSFGYWQALDVKAGTYDLLKLRNGVDTLLATGRIEGTLRKIRITVTAVQVVVNGIAYPVTLGADTGNYLYVRVHQEHLQSAEDGKALWIDFDVSRSIVNVNGTYYLRPVLKPFCDRNFGSLEGNLLPGGAAQALTCFNSVDTVIAIPDALGRYRIRGLDEGTYSVRVDATNGYRDTTLTGISISRGRNTIMPDIQLQK